MSELVAGLIGVVAGGLVTGAAQVFQTWQTRRLAGKVAARLIVGNLHMARSYVESVLEYDRWSPEPVTWETELADWRANREAFAADVPAGEWLVVDGAFAFMLVLGERADADAELNDADREFLITARKRFDQANRIATAKTGALNERQSLEGVLERLGE